MAQAFRLGLTEEKFWAMTPRKLVALIDAHQDIEDARLSRLAYVLQTGQLPPRGAAGAEDDDDLDTAMSALYM